MHWNYSRGTWPSGEMARLHPQAVKPRGAPVPAMIFATEDKAEARRLKAERRSSGLVRHRCVGILGVGVAVQKLVKVGEAWKTLCADGRWRAFAPLADDS